MILIASLSLQAPTPIPHLPVLYYIVSHNVSSNERVLVLNMSVNLEGTECGQTYYIAVIAVNAVGEGSVSTHSIVTGKHFLIVAASIIVSECHLTAVPASSSTACTTNTTDDTVSDTAATANNVYTTEPNSTKGDFLMALCHCNITSKFYAHHA